MASNDAREREIHGLEMVLAGLRQGLAFMPAGCFSEQVLRPFEGTLERRVRALFECDERQQA